MIIFVFLLLVSLIFFLGLIPAAIIYYHFKRFPLVADPGLAKTLIIFKFGTMIFTLLSLVFLFLIKQ